MPTDSDSMTEPTGRQLDALIAERVMGWHVESVQYPHSDERFDNWVDAEGVGHYSVERSAYDQWIPSEFLNQAMEVVEKLRQSGEWCCITLKSDYHYIWWVSLTRAEGATKLNPEHKPTIARSDESLPVAICRAALATATT